MDFLDGIPSEELGLAPVSLNGQYSDLVNGIKLDDCIFLIDVRLCSLF